MSDSERLQQEFIQDFGEAYRNFGLSRLMGHIVGLLLFSDGPVSLTEITETLKVSKGPVSQITRRLAENGLIRKVWVPGSRRDFYEAEDDIFGLAFARHAELFRRNMELSRKYADRVGDTDTTAPAGFVKRVDEMNRFYTLVDKHMGALMDEWRKDA